MYNYLVRRRIMHKRLERNSSRQRSTMSDSETLCESCHQKLSARRFGRIVGLEGRRTGWLGPKDVRKDSCGLLDVKEFFLKESSSTPSPYRLQRENEDMLQSQKNVFSPPKSPNFTRKNPSISPESLKSLSNRKNCFQSVKTPDTHPIRMESGDFLHLGKVSLTHQTPVPNSPCDFVVKSSKYALPRNNLNSAYSLYNDYYIHDDHSDVIDEASDALQSPENNSCATGYQKEQSYTKHDVQDSKSFDSLNNERNLMITEGISYFKNLEKSITDKKGVIGLDHYTKNGLKQDAYGFRFEKRDSSPTSRSTTDFSLGSLIGEARELAKPSHAFPKSYIKKKNVTDTLSESTIYPELKLLCETPTPVGNEKFKVVIPNDKTSEMEYDSDFELSSHQSSESLLENDNISTSPIQSSLTSSNSHSNLDSLSMTKKYMDQEYSMISVGIPNIRNKQEFHITSKHSNTINSSVKYSTKSVQCSPLRSKVNQVETKTSTKDLLNHDDVYTQQPVVDMSPEEITYVDSREEQLIATPRVITRASVDLNKDRKTTRIDASNSNVYGSEAKQSLKTQFEAKKSTTNSLQSNTHVEKKLDFFKSSEEIHNNAEHAESLLEHPETSVMCFNSDQMSDSVQSDVRMDIDHTFEQSDDFPTDKLNILKDIKTQPNSPQLQEEFTNVTLSRSKLVEDQQIETLEDKKGKLTSFQCDKLSQYRSPNSNFGANSPIKLIECENGFIRENEPAHNQNFESEGNSVDKVYMEVNKISEIQTSKQRKSSVDRLQSATTVQTPSCNTNIQVTKTKPLGNEEVYYKNNNPDRRNSERTSILNKPQEETFDLNQPHEESQGSLRDEDININDSHPTHLEGTQMTPAQVKRKRGRSKKPPLKEPHLEPENDKVSKSSPVTLHPNSEDNNIVNLGDNWNMEVSHDSVNGGAEKDHKDPSRENKKRGRKRQFKELPVLADDSSKQNDNGMRRSNRMRIGRLKFWEGERVVLGRNESGFYPVPVVKDIIRTNDIKQEREQKKSMELANKTKKLISKSAFLKPVTVYNIITGEEDKQNIVATPEMLDPRTVGTGNYKFQKVFSEGKFFASGMLIMPRGSEKPNKNSNKSAMIFFIVSGEVEVQVHKTKFVLKTGSQFFIPRGNQYRLANVGKKECKLFFCHGKEVPSEDLTIR